VSDSPISQLTRPGVRLVPRAALVLGALLMLTAFAGVGAYYPKSQTAPPKNRSKPIIAGDLREGETLTVSPGSWRGAKPMRFVYQWVSCTPRVSNCGSIRGAFGRRYELHSRDVGRRLIVSVTASNRDGGSSAQSDATAVVKSCG
jgi:hypothetical protein